MFKDKFLLDHPGTVIFPKNIALDFVNECRKNDISILGIDAFLVGKNVTPIEGFPTSEKSIQPLQDFSIDFSNQKFVNLSGEARYEMATALIKKSPDHIHFEISGEDL
jgi:hypothetical protein